MKTLHLVVTWVILVSLGAPAQGFPEYDFIIVGGGSAGAVIANRLSERADFDVMLIEAGGDQPTQSKVPSLFPFLPRTRVDWNITSEDGYNPECGESTFLNLTSGHVLGGGSNINYMFYVRGVPADFEPWAEAAQDGTWNWENVNPYFKKNEKIKSDAILASPYRIYHGRNGYIGVTRENRNVTNRYLEAFGELHDVLYDVNGIRKLGYTKQLYTIANRERQSTASTYLNVNRTNLHILKNTLVTEILFDDYNNAVGVKAVSDQDEILIFIAKKEVIVSAGALNTPKLLMLSGIGPEDHLNAMNIKVRSNLPVGFNYQDHVMVLLSFKMEESLEPPPPSDPGMFPNPAFAGYVMLKNNVLPQPDYQSINMFVPHDSPAPLQFCSFNLGYSEEICNNLYEGGRGRNTLLINFSLLHPKSRGRVVLRSRNPKDLPRVCTGTFSNYQDLEDLTTSVMNYIQVLNTTYFKSVNADVIDLKLPDCGIMDYNSRDYWRCYVYKLRNTIFHYIGTCAMGSVVDSRLRVFNVQRLRVADASVMPTLVSGNVNAAVMMIGEKVADMIKEDYSECYSNPDFLSIFYPQI